MSEGTRVFIGNLNRNARHKDIEKFFKGFGKVQDIVVKVGYGFIIFEDRRDADDACYELNGKDLCGERVKVEISRPKDFGRSGSRYDSSRGYAGPRVERPFRAFGGGGGGGERRFSAPYSSKYKVSVENLSSTVSWQDLKDYMGTVGECTFADAHKDHKNEGVVCFATYDDMKRAVRKLDKTELKGRKIHLIIEYHGKSGSRSRSKSRSRSRSSSSSRSRSRTPKKRSKRSSSSSSSASSRDARRRRKARKSSSSSSRSRSPPARKAKRSKSSSSESSREGRRRKISAAAAKRDENPPEAPTIKTEKSRSPSPSKSERSISSDDDDFGPRANGTASDVKTE